MQRRKRLALSAAGLAVVTLTPLAITASAGSALAASGSSPATLHLHKISSSAKLTGSGSQVGELRPAGGDDIGSTAKAVANRSARSQAAPTRGTPPPSGVTGVSLGVTNGNSGFEGINHRDQRLTDDGNQWSTTPPDQGLCASSSYVLESVNVALRVYSASNNAPLTAPMALNPFFGFSHEVVRNADGTLDASPHQLGDPSCVYDQGSGRFFLTVYDATSDTDGNATGPSFIDLAVSNSGDPRGTWTTYQLDTTDDGTDGTPVHPNCPCFADYPHLGTDANGLYITTNEYPQFVDGYDGANVYALAKKDVTTAVASPRVLQWNTARQDNGADGFTLAPALSSGTAYATANGGTMYFLSSDAAEEATDGPSTSVLLWSLTNTSTITKAAPTLALSHVTVTVPKYAAPPPSNQKAGSVPLADCLNITSCSKLALGTPDKYKESEFSFDSNDTRMMQAAYAHGNVWGALDTAVDVNGATKAGVAYYIVSPSGSLMQTKTIVVPNNNISYPALGVTSTGKAVMALTLVGADYFPSAAYVKLDDTGATPSTVQIVGAGAGPDDDFSGYRGFLYNRPRWGDYGAASVVGTKVWIASEYIAQTCTLSQYMATPFGSCGGTRTTLANWSTHVAAVTP